MTFKSFRFAEVMLSSEGKEQMKGTQMWDKGKKKGGEKERGGADQKGNRERKKKQQGGCLCGGKDDGEGEVLVKEGE